MHRLLAQRLAAVDADQDETWSQGIEELCGELLHLDGDVSGTLAAVVRASAVIQEFLLEAFVPLPADRQPVVEMVEWLLDNLHNEDHGPQPARSAPLTGGCPGAMRSSEG